MEIAALRASSPPGAPRPTQTEENKKGSTGGSRNTKGGTGGGGRGQHRGRGRGRGRKGGGRRAEVVEAPVRNLASTNNVYNNISLAAGTACVPTHPHQHQVSWKVEAHSLQASACAQALPSFTLGLSQASKNYGSR